jgi:hypothetical protein
VERSDLTKNGYALITDPTSGATGITCLDCLMTSWHPMDVKRKYCGNCHKFHG